MDKAQIKHVQSCSRTQCLKIWLQRLQNPGLGNPRFHKLPPGPSPQNPPSFPPKTCPEDWAIKVCASLAWSRLTGALESASRIVEKELVSSVWRVPMMIRLVLRIRSFGSSCTLRQDNRMAPRSWASSRGFVLSPHRWTVILQNDPVEPQTEVCTGQSRE